MRPEMEAALKGILEQEIVNLLAAKAHEKEIAKRTWLYEVAQAAAADAVSCDGEERATATAAVLDPYLDRVIDVNPPPDEVATVLLVRVAVAFHGLAYFMPVQKSYYLLLIRDIAFAILGETGPLEECLQAIRDMTTEDDTN